MAQYDVHRSEADGLLIVNCQSDLLSTLKTRFVIPLIREDRFKPESPRLNPAFGLFGRRYVLAPQGAMSVMVRDLGPAVASLDAHHFTIVAALDMLLHGF